MNISEIKKQLETTDRIKYEGKCHDCGKSVKVCIHRDDTRAIVIEGGAVYNPLSNAQIFLKCDNCFRKDRVLLNWQKCEVYTRVVGYLRPVQEFNLGKQEEYKMRKNYAIQK